MIKHDHIKKMLGNYYLGKTSIREEEELRAFFRSESIPDDLSAEAEMFTFFEKERAYSGQPDLERKISAFIIDARKSKEVNIFARYRYRWISGAAAMLLVLVAIFINHRVSQKDPYIVRQDTYEDPHRAYAEAKKAIFFVSEKLNSGVEYIQPVSSFSPGIQKLEYLSTLEETKKLISK